MNLDSAIKAAEESPSFTAESANFSKVTYYSEFETNKWSNSTSCVAISAVHNLVFSASNSTGFVGYIVVSEEPSSLSILGVTEQMHNGQVGSPSVANSNPTTPYPSLAIDGSASNFCGHSTNSCSTTLTTKNQYDVIIVYTLEALDLKTSCTFSVSDTAKLSWTLRSSVSGRDDGTPGTAFRDQVGEFWATAVGPLSSDVITESISGCASTQYGGEYNGLQTFGVTGANFDSPFDPNTAVPGATYGYSNSPSVGIKTSNSNDMVIGVAQQSSYGVLTASSGFSTIVQGGTGGATSDYQTVNSVQNSQVTFGDTATWYWEIIADAIQAPNLSAGITYSNEIWAGYGIDANANGNQIISAAAATFIQPGGGYPPTGCAALYHCSMGTWVGMSDNFAYLAQDGTSVVRTANSITYSAWYEMYISGLNNNTSILCQGTNGVIVSQGDEIFAETENNAIFPGGSDTSYNFYIYDYGSNTSCWVTNQYFDLPNAVSALYIEENNEYCYTYFGCASLPEFGTIIFGSAQLDIGQTFSWAYPLYAQGFYTEYYMANAPCDSNCGRPPGPPPDSGAVCGTFVPNVSTSYMDPSNYFNTTWDTSQYTPYWNSGC